MSNKKTEEAGESVVPAQRGLRLLVRVASLPPPARPTPPSSPLPPPSSLKRRWRWAAAAHEAAVGGVLALELRRREVDRVDDVARLEEVDHLPHGWGRGQGKGVRVGIGLRSG